MSEGDVASISQWGDDQPEGVSGVLIRVEPEPIDNFDDALVLGGVGFPVEPAELFAADIFVLIEGPLELELRLPGERFGFVDSLGDKS